MEFTPSEALDHGTLAEWALGEKRYIALLHASEQITNSIKSRLLAGTITRKDLHETGITVLLDPIFARDTEQADEAMLNAMHFRLNGMVALTFIGKSKDWGVEFNVKSYT